MPLEANQIVGERYRIVRQLGQGGMGAVYHGWDTRLNRPVALKEMTPQSGLDVNMLAELRQQFQQEAQVLATLVHPNLVRVTDYFSWGGNEYLVMDFVEGESLGQRIGREGTQPEGQVRAWAGQLLDALAHCHRHGVLHRDIKPHNIIITPENKAVLVDFGLVKLWDPRDPRTRTVMRGAGTPEYAPPEQYDMGLGHTNPRSDVYGLGATLYHALTGQAPPTATQRMASPASFVPPRRTNATISPATEAAVLKAMEIAMDRRFQSAEEMARALGLAPRPAPTAPQPVRPADQQAAPTTRIDAPRKRKGGALLGLGGAGLAAVGLLCLALAAVAVVIGLRIVGGDQATPATPTSQPIVTPPPPTATPPSATPTPRPLTTPISATPVPNVPQTGNVLFQDAFDDPSSGWETGEYDSGSVGYTDGAYFVIALGDSRTMWGIANASFDDVTIEVEATQVSAGPDNNNDYGVVCREQGDGSGYYLLISGDGGYAILKTEAGDFEPLVDWKSSPAIRRGNVTNHIRAVCDGDYLALIVNGELLAEVWDTTFGQGDIALTATSYEGAPTEAHFDNLVVYAP